MQQRNINKDCRVLFGDIFIVPFLGPALGYLTAQCAARGGEIWLHLTGMICPWAGNLTANFRKMSIPHPMPCHSPAGFTLIGALVKDLNGITPKFVGKHNT